MINALYFSIGGRFWKLCENSHLRVVLISSWKKYNKYSDLKTTSEKVDMNLTKINILITNVTPICVGNNIVEREKEFAYVYLGHQVRLAKENQQAEG